MTLTVPPSPALMPRRPRGYRAPLDQGGPWCPGHHQALAHHTTGRVAHVDGRWRWAWPEAGDPPVSQPLAGYLDQLLRAGEIAAGDVAAPAAA